MRHITIMLVCLFLAGTSYGQRYDSRWLCGYGAFADTTDTNFGINHLNFNVFVSPEYPDVFYENRRMNFNFTGLTISKPDNGDLWFYSNGIYIANWLDEEIENSYGLNPGWMFDEFEQVGYNNSHSLIALPLSDVPNSFTLFHSAYDLINPNGPIRVNRLLMTQLDMDANNGKGRVIVKNDTILHKILEAGLLTAARHGNGTDWWIVLPDFASNCYNIILLNATGQIVSKKVQCLGTPWVDDPKSGAQAKFSPDGSKYARHSIRDDLIIMDFDRCTGEFSNPLEIEINDKADEVPNLSTGVIFSENSRFLYISSIYDVYQFDMWADDIAASKYTVASEFGSPDSSRYTFTGGQLAKTGWIIINPSSALYRYLHVIKSPNEKGDACDFEYEAITMPAINALTIPNYPNYQLGALEDSPCDTITTSLDHLPSDQHVIKIFPNPSNGQFKVETNRQGTIRIINSQGVVCEVQEVTNLNTHTVHMDIKDPGMYFIHFTDEQGRLLGIEKLIVVP